MRRVALPSISLLILAACTATGAQQSGANVHVPPGAATSAGDALGKVLDQDPREERCPIQTGKVFTSRVEISSGEEFWGVFPKAGLAPEMSDAVGPVFLAVYPEGFHGPMGQLPGTEPRNDEPDSGTVDVCAVFADGSRVIYGDIPTEGSALLN